MESWTIVELTNPVIGATFDRPSLKIAAICRSPKLCCVVLSLMVVKSTLLYKKFVFYKINNNPF